MSEVQQIEAPQPTGPGQLLKNARLAHHLSLEQIGSRLHLKVSLLTELENDHYDQGISMTFIKGYLKLYARQVGVTEAEILDALDTLNMHKKEPAKLQSFSRRVAHQANDDKLMLVTYLILAAVVALVVIWWFQQDTNDTSISLPQIPSDTATQTDAGSAAAKPVTLKGEPVLVTPKRVTSVPFVAQPAVTQEEDQQIVSTEAEDAQLSQTQASSLDEDAAPVSDLSDTPVSASDEGLGKVQLVFEFMDDCWVSLIDGTGEVIAYGVKVAGRVMTVSGVPPFKIILGAPSGVKINYAGEDVDMSKFSADYTAEFTLPITQ